MIVDAHAHIFERVKGKTGAGPTASLDHGKVRQGDKVMRLLPPLALETGFAPEVLLEYMDWAGVDRAVLLQGPLYGEANQYVADAARRWPGRFIGAAYFDPWSENAQAEFNHVVDDLDLRIIKIELREDSGLAGIYDDVRLNGAKLKWLWKEAEKRKITVTLDLGPIGGKGYQTEAIRGILDSHPGLKIVMTHLCYPPFAARDDEIMNKTWEEQVLLARRPGVWLDLASLPDHVKGEEYPFPGVYDFIRRAAGLAGAEKLLWGTDIPSLLKIATYHQLLGMITIHCGFLSEKERAGIMGENALRAYGAP